ncbi:hypothetical protein ACOSQ4_026578 [Xanthoceras sorbifolium]
MLIEVPPLRVGKFDLGYAAARPLVSNSDMYMGYAAAHPLVSNSDIRTARNPVRKVKELLKGTRIRKSRICWDSDQSHITPAFLVAHYIFDVLYVLYRHAWTRMFL